MKQAADKQKAGFLSISFQSDGVKYDLPSISTWFMAAISF